MLSFLKNHPFAVEAYFDSSLVLTFAFPNELLQPLIPECLQLDTFQDKWAFVAVALVQTKGLRPKGLPAILGNDFFLIGYRIFVRYTTNAGKNLRGLYILKSETDSKKMEVIGNLFTHYKYTSTDITIAEAGESKEIFSSRSDFKVVLDTSKKAAQLPENSPFVDWKEARRFAGPLPFTFTFNPATKEVLIVEGVRQHWIPTPVNVLEYHVSFLKTLSSQEPVLANAFILHDIPYFWKKGKNEVWAK
jgi:hypothetical protein